MSQNVRSELTSKQRKALAALLEGGTLETVALAAKVNVRTVHRWQRDPVFVAELKAGQKLLAESHLIGLSSELRRNRAVIAEVRDDPESPAAVRLRAAQTLDELLLKWRKSTDIEDQLFEMVMLQQSMRLVDELTEVLVRHVPDRTTLGKIGVDFEKALTKIR